MFLLKKFYFDSNFANHKFDLKKVVILYDIVSIPKKVLGLDFKTNKKDGYLHTYSGPIQWGHVCRARGFLQPSR